MSAIILRYTNANSITTPSANRSAVFVDENGALTIKNDTGNITSFEVGPAGNTHVFFNTNGNFAGSANFTFNSSTNVLTVLGNIAATRVLTDNLLYANGSAWDMQQPSGSNGEIQFNNNDSFGATGNLKLLSGQQLLVGATASNTNFPSSRLVVSQDDAGNSSTDNIGIAAEAVANSANSSVTGIGVLGHARANGATKGTGIQGQAFVTASGDTGAAVGVRAYAIDTHSGGYNIGFLGNAMNSSVGNYAFYVQNGGIASIENNTFWDLNDNSNAALTFNSTGKANIFGIETTDNSEGIFTSGYLNVTGNISALGIKTNNYYYSNGSPVDFQQAAGSNTQIQYNNANDFGASANFTFNSATNVLTVTGNISTGNVSATGAVNAATLGGSLTTAAQGNITSVGTLTSLTVSGNITSGNIDGGNLVKGNYVQGTLTTAAQPNITSVGTLSSASVTGNVTAGNVYANSGTVGASLLTGTLTTNAQPNVTSVGTLSSLTVTGNVGAGNLNATIAVVASTLTSNVTTGTAPLTVTSTTRVANLNVNYANVSDFNVITAQSTGIYYPTFINGNSTANYALAANAGFSANLANGGLIATTFVGNVSGNITGTLANGTSSVSIPASNGNVNISVAGNANIVAVTGTGVNVAGTLNATGNANVNNLGTAQVLATANVTAPIFISNVAQGTAPLTVTSNTKVTNFNADLLDGYDTATAATANTVVVRDTNGNITGNNISGTLSTAAQPNITSVGTLTSLSATGTVSGGNLSTGGNLSVSGNAIISGNLTVDGNLTYVNVDTLAVEDPIIQLQTGPNGAAPAANSGKDVGTGLNYYDTQARIAWMGWDVSNVEFGMGSVVTIASEVVTFSTYGNLRVGNIIGNGQALTGITGANVTGTVANATYATSAGSATTAGTVTTAAQGNITSVGTLTSLGVSGTITAANITANTGIFTGNGSGLSQLTGANVTGTVANATFATSAGSATNASAVLTNTSTNTTVYLTGTQSSANGNVSLEKVTGIYANMGNNAITATTFVGALSGNATTAGTVVTAAQPNITSVGTLTSLSIDGNLTFTGVARRILADFSNSNRANRGMFQTSTADSPSRVGVIPNGTNTVCEFSLYNSSDPANAGIGNLLLNATEFRLTAGNSGSGTQIPMTFYAGGSEQMRIITGGNVGIGNTAPTHKLSVTGTMNVSGNANVGNIGATSGEFTTVNVSGNITGPNHIANTGFFISSVTTGISAAGTVQGNATALTTMFNVVSTVNSGTGVVLPTAVAGMRVTVMNTGGNTLNVYPATNGIINSAAANIAYSLNAGGRLDFCAVSTTQWYTLSATFA